MFSIWFCFIHRVCPYGQKTFTSLQARGCKTTPTKVQAPSGVQGWTILLEKGTDKWKEQFWAHSVRCEVCVRFLFIFAFQTRPKSKFKFALLSVVEQSAHPILGPDALKASYFSRQIFQGKDGSPPRQRLTLEVCILSAWRVLRAVFHSSMTRERLAVTVVACRVTP